jgi:carboxyl-terminal processing protease
MFPQKRPHVFAFVLLALLLCCLSVVSLQTLPAAAAPAGNGLLTEIREIVDKYYLFAPAGGVVLETLDDLPRIWRDPYSRYLREEQVRLFAEGLGRYLTGIGVHLEQGPSAVTVVSTVPDSPACRAGLQRGDRIVYVDGRFVMDAPLDAVVVMLRGEAGTSVRLMLLRGEQLLTFSLVRRQIRLPAAEYVRLEGNIAWLRLYNLDSGAARELSSLMDALEAEGVRGFVLDLRANQGGYVDESLAVANLFTRETLLRQRERVTGWQLIKGQNPPVTALPLVVLVNRGTASGAEIVAAALKDNGRALLVGELTFGKGMMQRIMPLRHGGYLKLTTAEFTSPRMRQIEGVGVEPHFFRFDPREQQDLAAELLRDIVRLREGAKRSYLEQLLRRHFGPTTPFPLTLQAHGEDYYPLRAILALTGRTIIAETRPGIYSFSWEGRRFRLDLPARLLISPQPGMADPAVAIMPATPVLLREGNIFVPVSFLERELGLPYLRH